MKSKQTQSVFNPEVLQPNRERGAESPKQTTVRKGEKEKKGETSGETSSRKQILQNG